MRWIRVLLVIVVLISMTPLTVPSQLPAKQVDVVKASKLKQQANEMAEAFSKGDFAAFVKFMYPKMLQAQGGADAMVRMLNQQVQEWQAKGMAIRSVAAGEPSQIFKAGNELHALIGQTVVMQVKGGTLTQNSYLLAISPNNGAKWYFMDTAPLNNSNVRRLFPNYNKNLVIPAKQQPVFKAE